MAEEKRRYTRWKEKIRVSYSLTEGDNSYREIFAEDIAEVGVQILVPERFILKQKVKLKLEFAYDSVPIMAYGQVVYVKPYKDRYKVGLEFVDMDEFQKHRLKRCLDKLRKDSGDRTEQGHA